MQQGILYTVCRAQQCKLAGMRAQAAAFTDVLYVRAEEVAPEVAVRERAIEVNKEDLQSKPEKIRCAFDCDSLNAYALHMMQGICIELTQARDPCICGGVLAFQPGIMHCIGVARTLHAEPCHPARP